jgi:hypothetical protein
MQKCTAFRLAMLANGFQPLLNKCKQPIETGWPRKIVDEAEVRSWDRSALTSTGLKIDGDLAVVDVDVADASLVAALADAGVRTIDSELSRSERAETLHMMLWHCGVVRIAAAIPAPRGEPHERLIDARDPGFLGPAGVTYKAVRKHNRAGDVISIYQFTGGASPATMPRASLPVLPKAAYALACDLFDEIAAAAGLTAVGNGRGATAMRCFELDADTEIETQDHGVMTVAELEHLMRTQQARAGATLRCSGSFHDQTRTRTDSHLINWGRHGLGIFDTMTETTWHRRERAPSARFEFLNQLRARNPFR